MEKIAVIDLGTNTFHLLIAGIEGGKTSIILDEKIPVKIGQGGININFISSEAYARGLKTLAAFKELLTQHQVNKTIAIATSALRNARNGINFIQDVKTKTGIEITLVSGDKEAELIYEGVKYAFDLGKSTSIIMDIGGGSVEFIICNNDQIFWKKSFEIGAQRLMDIFHKSDPISPVEVQRLINYLEEQLIPLFEATKQYKPTTLIGASGTFDTLCEIDVIEKGIAFDMEKEKDYSLTITDFENISFRIINNTKEERMLIPGMAEMRVDMIVVACILIQYVEFKVKFQKIRVCPFALKEGVLSCALSGNEIYK